MKPDQRPAIVSKAAKAAMKAEKKEHSPSQAAYNWCIWLEREKGVKPSQLVLQDIVATADLDDKPNGGNGRMKSMPEELHYPRAMWVCRKDIKPLRLD